MSRSSPSPSEPSTGTPARPRQRGLLANFKRGYNNIVGRVVEPAVTTVAEKATDLAGIYKLLRDRQLKLDELQDRVNAASAFLGTGQSGFMNEPLRGARDGLESIIGEIRVFIDHEVAEPTLHKLVSQQSFLEEETRLRNKLADAMVKVEACMLTTLLENAAVTNGALLNSSTVDVSGSSALVIPRPTPHLVGRDAFTSKIVSRLITNTKSHLAILGPGGIGKTTVALSVLNDLGVEQKFLDNRVYLNCDSIETAAGLCEGLWKLLRGKVPTAAAPSIAVAVKKLKGPKLLVLDDFETVWEGTENDKVEQLLSEVTAVSDLSLLVAMRGAMRPLSVQWSRPCLPQLEPLLLSDAKLMFLSISGIEDDCDVDELLEQLGGLPLAIKLMAMLAQVHSPRKLLEFYRTERTALLETAVHDGKRISSLEVSVNLSLKSPKMKNNTKALEALRILALLPQGALWDPYILHEIFPGLRTAEIEVALRTLIEVALATKTETSIVYVLPPIRDFIRRQYPSSPKKLERLQALFLHRMRLQEGAEGHIKLPNADYVGPMADNFHAIYLATLEAGQAVDDRNDRQYRLRALLVAATTVLNVFRLDKHLPFMLNLVERARTGGRDNAYEMHRLSLIKEWCGMALYGNKECGLAISMLSGALESYNQAIQDCPEWASPLRFKSYALPGQQSLRPLSGQLVVLGNEFIEWISANYNNYGTYATHIQKRGRWYEAAAVFLKGFQIDLEGRPITWHRRHRKEDEATIDNLLSACYALGVFLGSMGYTEKIPLLKERIFALIAKFRMPLRPWDFDPPAQEDARRMVTERLDEGLRKAERLLEDEPYSLKEYKKGWPVDRFVSLLVLQPRISTILDVATPWTA